MKDIWLSALRVVSLYLRQRSKVTALSIVVRSAGRVGALTKEDNFQTAFELVMHVSRETILSRLGFPSFLACCHHSIVTVCGETRMCFYG